MRVGFSVDFIKNPFRIFGAGTAGWGRRRDLSKFLLRTFWTKRDKWILRTFSNFDNPGSQRWWRRRWILRTFGRLSYSGAVRRPWASWRRRGGVGFLNDFGKNPFRIFGAGTAGWGRRRDLSKFLLRTFWAKRRGVVWRTFSNLNNPGPQRLPRRRWIRRRFGRLSYSGAAGQPWMASKKVAGADESRLFGRFYQKSISDFGGRHGGVGAPA